MNAYKFNAVISEDHTIAVPLEVPEGEAEILVLVSKTGQKDATDEIPIWEAADALMKDVPDEVLEQLPSDGAHQHDHYIYGTPKK